MAESVAEEILSEIGEIEHLFTFYADLLARVQQHTPDRVEVAALAMVLHSFYIGLENIFTIVAKRIDQKVSEGAQWHRVLLAQMCKPTERRARVISEEQAKQLMPYLQFRHVVRHGYAFDFDWTEMATGARELHAVWAQTKTELLQFVATLHEE